MNTDMKQTVPLWLMLVVLSVVGALSTRQLNSLEKQINTALTILATHDRDIAVLKNTQENTKAFQEQALKNQLDLIAEVRGLKNK